MAEIRWDSVSRDSHGNDVAEHQCPAGDKSGGVIKTMSGESGRTTGLGQHGGAFGVSKSIKDKKNPGYDQYNRCGSQGYQGHDTQGVIDGRADIAIAGAEQGRYPQHPSQAEAANPSGTEDPVTGFESPIAIHTLIFLLARNSPT